MMKSEFETLIDRKVNDDEFTKIETVYMYYPGIDDKNQIAQLYIIGGNVLINDMLDRAEKIKRCEEIISIKKQELEALNHA